MVITSLRELPERTDELQRGAQEAKHEWLRDSCEDFLAEGMAPALYGRHTLRAHLQLGSDYVTPPAGNNLQLPVTYKQCAGTRNLTL